MTGGETRSSNHNVKVTSLTL